MHFNPLTFVAIFCPILGALARKNKYIVPGATWYDTDGNILSAHAGGIVETGGKWYWFGQNERKEDTTLFSGASTIGCAPSCSC